MSLRRYAPDALLLRNSSSGSVSLSLSASISSRIAFGPGVGKGHIRIAEEAQYIVPAPLEAQQEIVPDASRLGAAALGTTDGRLRFVEGDPLGHDGVVASLDAGNEASCKRHPALAGKVCRVAGAPQQDLHFARPVFLLDGSKLCSQQMP
jgi:hypothetical protein